MWMIIAMIAGAVLKAVTGFMEAQSGAKTEEYSAKIAERQANIATMKAAYAEEMSREKGKRLLATQKSVAGASGLTIESFLPTFEQTVKDNELDALAIRWSGEVERGGLLAEAEGHRFAAKQAKRAGYISLLTGQGQNAGQFAQIRGSQGAATSSGVSSTYESYYGTGSH